MWPGERERRLRTGRAASLQPDSPALKLGFQPIDVSQVGLTGPPELVKLARGIQRPPLVVPRRESVPPLVLDEGFENTPLGMSPDHAY